MPTNPIDRLLFAQGGKCFFCEQPLPRAQASVEHLMARANGGSNCDGNCVACCKAVNALLGCMSLKEKLRVVLNQLGRFVCPAGGSRANRPVAGSVAVPRPSKRSARYELALANLKSRGESKPRKSETLRNTIATLFPAASMAEVEAIVVELKAAGKLSENNSTVSYGF